MVELDVFPELGDGLVVDEEIAFATSRTATKYFLPCRAVSRMAPSASARGGRVIASGIIV